uniref:uncharacterized protein LOC120346315 n=1 Tax=Styela clava TaxID=7725 RepID=UPI0019392EC5|nr:uncharacterized protein LOC120346315 [Styela clava]XP_039271958.1 uncharacterized protein LOC120346315 [Styela clava]
MKIPLTNEYRFTISGVGITQVALGCCIFSLGLSGATNVTDSLAQYQDPYLAMSLITGVSVITSGAISHCAATKATHCYLFLILITSSLSIVFTLSLIGIQTFLTAEYADIPNHSPTFMASLILGSVSAVLSFFTNLAAIALTCTAGGACNHSSNAIMPTDDNTGSTKQSSNV